GDLSIISYGAMVHRAVEAAEILAAEGIDSEVLDLRSLSPLDRAAILTTARRTTRVIVAHEDNLTGGAGGEIAALIAEHAFEWLDAPVRRVAALDVPVPYARPLEEAALPSAEQIAAAARGIAAY
ncbi:MAG: transketolase C-terminal domain-containing protein, partial [Planctomycetota bacterium]